MIIKLPDVYPFGELVRIGPRIFCVVVSVGHWHWLQDITSSL